MAGLSASAYVLSSDARPTPRSHDADDAEEIFASIQDLDDPKDLKPTEPRDMGPFYMKGAPYRAKITPPVAVGTVLVVSGRVWSYETKRPVPGTLLDLWQVNNATEKYSNEKGDFENRSRLMTDENGYYEFESVHPKPYMHRPDFWRSPHIHVIATAAEHKRLTTEIFFKYDPKQDVDSLFHPSLVVPVKKQNSMGKEFETCVFDIVLKGA